MTELKLISKQGGSLQTLIEGVIADALRSTETGIEKTEARLRSFEQQYQLSTSEFLERYSNDEFQETLELDEWIGESRMLKRLQEKAERLRGVELVY
jgi:hypothetical protein